MRRTFERAGLILIMLASFGSTALAFQNPYDKFRNREYTNAGYISEEEELKLAGQVHSEVIREFRLVQNQPVNAYITDLGNRLAQRSERPRIPWKFYVVDDKSVNAFATLGGRVYIHTGLIAATTTEAQLASVMGHEIGHIVGRHGLENVKRAQKIGIGAAAASIVGAIIGGRVGSIVDLAGNLIAGGYLMKHSRDAEREAVARGTGVTMAALRPAWDAAVDAVLAQATLRRSATTGHVTSGKQGQHSEHLSYLLAEMQSLARAHPDAQW